MTISQSLQQRIADFLLQESTLCSTLKTALNDERSALEKRDFDIFNHAVQIKQQCVDKLAQVEKKLFQSLTDAGFSENREGFLKLLSLLKSAQDSFGLQKKWHSLQKLMTECKDMNLVNGQMINVSMVDTRQALNIISGRDPQPSTYDQSGKTTNDDDNQNLIIA